jgi:3-hydroxymyristoyl/3-hydroxydecanoyl-(acyl carrier protein) dehydratase
VATLFGLKVIERLLPHRPPFLMVESVAAYAGGEAPTLNAERFIHSSESVFAGAKPPLCWPSLYVIEGLGQSCNLLSLIWTLERNFAVNGLDAEMIGSALMSMEANDGDYTTELLSKFLGGGAMKISSKIGLLASVDVEITGRVCAGELLRYEVRRSHVVGELSRFTVRACVGERVIVHGAIVGAQLEGTA